MAYHGSKKNSGRNPGRRSYTEEEIRAIGWCHNRKIFVAITPSEGDDWSIEIKINNKTYTDPKAYSGKEALDKMYEYYKYYHDKNRK
tara:strand:+ start:221 stop:481 length:261 start_codon:yes stop_codon:yes gene_type:complete